MHGVPQNDGDIPTEDNEIVIDGSGKSTINVEFTTTSNSVSPPANKNTSGNPPNTCNTITITIIFITLFKFI